MQIKYFDSKGYGAIVGRRVWLSKIECNGGAPIESNILISEIEGTTWLYFGINTPTFVVQGDAEREVSIDTGS